MVTVERSEVPGIARPVGRYSTINVAPSDHRIGFVSGLFGIEASGALAGTDTRTQSIQMFASLATLLDEAGVSPAHVLYLNTYLTRDASVDEFMAVRNMFFDKWFDHEGEYPGSTVLIVHALVAPKFLVEIDATVAFPLSSPKP